MTKSILFIDDSTIEYELFLEAASMIRYQGRMRCITDPRRVFHELQDKNDMPDLIMVDIRMPHVSGHELIKKLKSHPRYCFIYTVMFSSSDLNRDREMALECGANYFFNKPDKFMDYPILMRQLLIMANENRINKAA